MKFSDQILKIREDYHLTQEDLANSLNVTRQAASKWERDLSYPDVETIKEIAKKYNVSLNVLLGLVETNKSDENKPLAYKSFSTAIFVILTIIIIILSIAYVASGGPIKEYDVLMGLAFIIVGFFAFIFNIDAIFSKSVRISYNDYGLYINQIYNKIIFVPYHEIVDIRSRNASSRNYHWYTFGRITIETKDETYHLRGVAQVHEIRGKLIELKVKNTMLT